MSRTLTEEQRTKYRGTVFSFGAGVQSVAILLLILYDRQKILDRLGSVPDYILFADTLAEKEESLKMFEHCKTLSDIPLYRVVNWKNNAKVSPYSIPAFIKTETGSRGQILRRCTRDWKIVPIRRAIRKLYPKASFIHPISLWLGISTDEAHRVKRSNVKYLHHRYPLLELGLSRSDCLSICAKYNLKPVKSCCYMCPYQVNNWKDNKEIDKAIDFENYLQANSKENRLTGVPFLHPDLEPIEEVYQRQKDQYNLFGFDDECDGFCGV